MQLVIKRNRVTSNATVIYSIADKTVHKSKLQKHNIRTDLKPLKRTGRCKVFLDFDRRAAVTFGPPTRIVEGKLLSNLMKRVPKAPHKENQMRKKPNASEAELKVRVQFTKHVEELTSLKRNKQSKHQPSNSSTSIREKFQSTAQRYDKNFQDLMEEVNTKTGIGYKIIEDSDRPNKLKVLYQQTVHLLEVEIPKQLQRQNKLVPYQANFVEEHLKDARKCKASLDYHWLAYISKSTQPAMNAEQSNTTQALNDNESNNNYPVGQPRWTTQLLEQCKMEQQQVAKRRRMFRKHLQQIKGARKG